MAEARRGGSAGHVGPGIQTRRSWGLGVSARRTSCTDLRINFNVSRGRKREECGPCVHVDCFGPEPQSVNTT